MGIWQRGAAVSAELSGFADTLESRKPYGFAEQFRAATLGVTNNIAEGSGSDSHDDFTNVLKFARRSVFEAANIHMPLSKQGYVERATANNLLAELEEQSKMILAFRRALKRHA